MTRLLTLPLPLLSAAAFAQTTPQASPAPDVPGIQSAPAKVSMPDPSVAPLNARLATPLPADQAALKAHVLFLASDAMKGREAGSPEYDIAAQYVAAQFYAAGLAPAGDAVGYLQAVPLVSYQVGETSSFVVGQSSGRDLLKLGEDYVPSPNAGAAKTQFTAPVSFAGYGIVAPHYARDDYAGIDVRGRIVAVMSGAPADMSGEERAFFGSSANKAAMAAARGARGVIVVNSARAERIRPFARTAETYRTRRMTWANPDGTGHLATPGTPVLGTLSQAGAAKLFGASWHGVARESAKARARFRSIVLPVTLSIDMTTTFAPARSSNVVGVLRGSDPALAAETVVLSAHLDHIGVSEKPVEGDAINNGALDNAIGIASLIEEAKRFRAAGAPPRRSVIFLAVTAEEKGLVGSDYFANHPTVPLASIVADVNLDMPILTYRFEDMVAFGGDRSTLGPIIARAVGAIGVSLAPDPMPEEGIFVRSDHFRFVEKGIPSVFLWPGQKGAGKEAVAAFMSLRYHRPSDDLTQPIDWSQGPRFVDANYRIARDIADADARPVWNKGDYFGTLFKGPMAE